MSATTSVVDRWSDYVHARALGDPRAVWSPVQGDELDGFIAHELTDQEVDDLVWLAGGRLAHEQTRRSSFGSELFPMGSYISMSQIETWYAWPDRMRLVEQTIKAQDIARPTTAASGVLSDLWVWMSGYFPLSGRELLIKLDLIEPEDHVEDIRTVVDFWRRLALSRRGDGTLDNADAHQDNRCLDDEVVQRLIDETEPLNGDQLAQFERFNGTMAGYEFMLFTDSRSAICDTGPYPVDDDHVLVVRDYMLLGTGYDFAWAKDLDVPHQCYTIAMKLDRSKLDTLEISDWGTTFAEPRLLDAVVGAAVIGNSPTDWDKIPPSRYVDLTKAIATEHMKLYKWFARASMHERTIAATEMYGWALRPIVKLAGVDDQMDWTLHPKTLELYPDPLGDTDMALALYASIMPRESAFSRFL